MKNLCIRFTSTHFIWTSMKSRMPNIAEFLNAKGKHAEAGKEWYLIGNQKSRIEYASRKYQVKGGYENHPVTMGELVWCDGVCGMERETFTDRGGMGEGSAWGFIGSEIPVGQHDRFHQSEL